MGNNFLNVLADGATESDDKMVKDKEKSRDGPTNNRKPDDENSVVHGYNPKMALKRAIEDWIPEFYQPKGTSKRFTAVAKQLTDEAPPTCDGSNSNMSNQSDSGSETHSDSNKEEVTTKKSSSNSSSDSNETKKSAKQQHLSKKDLVVEAKDSGKRKIEELEPLSNSDVQTMCDLFYLPFQHGSRGVYLLKEAHWLVAHAGRVKDCYKIPQSEQVRTVIGRTCLGLDDVTLYGPTCFGCGGIILCLIFLD